MLIKCLPVGHLMTNCYIVTDETTLECAVIDPGDESNTILYYLEDNHLTCRAILLTHGHYDHTGAVYAVHEETGAPVYMNALDAGTAVAFDSYTFTPPEGTIFYKEGDEVKVGNLTFRVMETPGHTPGGGRRRHPVADEPRKGRARQPHLPRLGHPQRHDQLHHGRDARQRRRLFRRARAGAGARLCRG